MKHSVFAALASVLLLINPVLGEKLSTPDMLPLGMINSSYSMNPFSGLVNPAFSGEKNSPFLSYSFTNSENSEKANHFASLNLLGFNFIYGNYGYLYDDSSESIFDEKADLYHIHKGFMFDNTFGFGAGFTWFKSDYMDLNRKLFNVGIIIRPADFLSMGYSIREVSLKEDDSGFGYTQNFSISVRPLHWITFTGSCDRFYKDDFRDAEYSALLEVITPGGVTLRGGGGTGGYYSLSAEIPFDMNWNGGTFRPGYQFSHSDNPKGRQSQAWAAISSMREKTAINRCLFKKDIHLKLTGKIAENTARPFFSKRSMNFQEYLKKMEHISAAPEVDSLFIEIDSPELGIAQIEELRSSIKKFRENGKRVYAQLNSTGNREYYIACAADKIFLAPGTGFSIRGLSAEVYFIRGLLDKGGIKYESIRYGKYKSFNETFTRTGMSKELRENLEKILNDLNDQFISAITESRNKSREDIENLFKKGFLTPSEAVKLGYVDGAGYLNETKKKLSPDHDLVKFSAYNAPDINASRWSKTPSITIVHADGTILKGGADSGSGGITEGSFIKSMERAFADSKAVILRVNSGGGSASASDFMLQAVKRLKDKYKKPLVISFGNTAASGGYYISCTGDRIFTDKGTITGSIGVVGGKISLQRLYKMLGINKETIKTAPHADIFSESRDLTEEEREILQDSVDFIYKRFTAIVMNGRKIKKNRIDSLAQGRVFTGNQSLKNGLTDKHGGILAALEFARVKAKIGRNYRIKNLPEISSFPSIPGISGITASNKESEILKFLSRTFEGVKAADSGGYIIPYFVEIK